MTKQHQKLKTFSFIFLILASFLTLIFITIYIKTTYIKKPVLLQTNAGYTNKTNDTSNTYYTYTQKSKNPPLVTITADYNKNTDFNTQPNTSSTKVYDNFYKIPEVYLKIPSKSILLPSKTMQKCLEFSAKTNPAYTLNTKCLEKELKQLLAKHLTYKTIKINGKNFNMRQQDYAFNTPKLARIVASSITSTNTTTNPVQKQTHEHTNKNILEIQVPILWKTPNTNGTLANTYLEADHSRQLLFLWNNGTYETFLMSGTYDGYTPFGIHQIYYKSPKAWSKYSRVWMPYWMAFTQDPITGGRIGLHGLVYYCPERIEQYCDSYIHEPESNLGTPKSKGCLRVSPQNAKYIYNKVKIGTYIIVHE